MERNQRKSKIVKLGSASHVDASQNNSEVKNIALARSLLDAPPQMP